MNKSITDKELLNILKNRLTKNPKISINDCIYQEYLELCDEYMKKAMPNILVRNSALVDSLRYIATLCDKIDVGYGKKIKRIPVLESITRNIQFIDSTYASLEFEGNKTYLKIVDSLANQARGYVKQAFKCDMFDTAGTSLNDAADIFILAQSIYVGDLKEASKCWDFDTRVREQISQKTWDWMNKNLERSR